MGHAAWGPVCDRVECVLVRRQPVKSHVLLSTCNTWHAKRTVMLEGGNEGGEGAVAQSSGKKLSRWSHVTTMNIVVGCCEPCKHKKDEAAETAL